MKTARLQEVIEWLKSTDLVEVRYNDGGNGFSLSTAEASSIAPAIPAARCAPVCSPAVGMFQFSKLGQARRAEEGTLVAEGDLLGIVETGRDACVQVKSPCRGRIARVFIEAASPVEFGQPLFFLEPQA